MADKYIVTREELETLAGAIRTKAGKDDSYKLSFPAGMAEEISNITTGGGESTLTLKPGEYEDYIKKEALRVANAVGAVKETNSIISLCMSDSHYHSESGEYKNSRGSATTTLKAIKALSYFLPIDFIAHLGDVGVEDETGTATLEQLKSTSDELLEMLKETCGGSIPLFVAIGNHDANTGIADKTGLSNYLYNSYTKLSDSPDTVFGPSTSGGGYCYRDIGGEDKKLRVFLLNTCETQITNESNRCIGKEQADWVLSKISELNSKKDPDQWKFIILSHYPLDYSNTKTDLCNALQTYVSGEDYTNKAKFLCQFHGHIHNFLYDKLHYGDMPSGQVNKGPYEQYGVLRVAIPSTELGRENAYYQPRNSSGEVDPNSKDGTTWGIKFFEGIYNGYSKKPTPVHPVTGDPVTITKGDEEKCTSFVVNVINPNQNKIYSFCYGAGYDRVISYDFSKTQYPVSFTLENMEIPVGTIKTAFSGDEYTVQLYPTDGYKLSSSQVTVKMNNELQSGVCEYGEDCVTITIKPVMGPIVITGVATEASHFKVSRVTPNIICSNPDESVTNDDSPSYYTVLTPTSGMLINPYLTKVTMGGVDISDGCVSPVGDGYEINISPVTGPITIEATASKSNLWKYGYDLADTSTIYNGGLGYKNGVRLSSSGGAPVESANSPYVLTGLIPYSIKSAVPQKNYVIEIKGVTLDTTDSNCRLFPVCESGTLPNRGLCAGKTEAWDGTTADTSRWEYSWKFITRDDTNKHYVIAPNLNSNTGLWLAHQGSSYQVSHIVMSMKGKGENFSIDIREP